MSQEPTVIQGDETPEETQVVQDAQAAQEDQTAEKPQEEVEKAQEAASKGPEDEQEPTFTVIDRRFWARRDDDEDEDANESPKKPSYVGELERKLEEREERLAATLAQHRAAVGEFENARARLQRDVAKEVDTHKRRVLTELLEVLDNLERAIEAGQNADDTKSLRDGIALVRDQFVAKLSDFGVRRVESLGHSFDPVRHEALSAIPVADAEQDGKIVGVIKECYLIGDETLRPAMVAVGRAANDKSA